MRVLTDQGEPVSCEHANVPKLKTAPQVNNQPVGQPLQFNCFYRMAHAITPVLNLPSLTAPTHEPSLAASQPG